MISATRSIKEMKQIEDELQRRGICGDLYTNISNFDKNQAIKVLSECAYGTLPSAPIHLRAELQSTVTKFCAGTATLSYLTLFAECEDGTVSFPIFYARPKRSERIPAFIFLNFREGAFDDYLPIEEIMDRGYAVFGICYKNVTADSKDFNSGIARVLVPSRKRKNAPGKLALWAWSAMRVMDYALTLPEIDADNIAVIGHSRLGKTALLTAALDERFRYAISNDSGCLGASLTRGKSGECYEDIYERFPYWFTPDFKRYLGKSDTLPYDQHQLIGLIAPRYCLIGSATEDTWADPDGELLGAYVASGAWRAYGKTGLISDSVIPDSEFVLHEGEIGYHRRLGIHYLSRRDWNHFMDFMDKKMQK